MRGRVILAAVSAVLAIVLALTALSVRDAADSATRAELRAAEQPNAVHAFSLGGPLPSGVPEWLLGLGDDRAFARALDEARSARALADQPGPDAQRLSGVAQGDLSPFEADRSDPARADLAATLGGVLAFQDSRAQTGGGPTNTDRALAAFRRAIEVDPNADAAAYDLELLLRRETAAGIRNGGAPTPGGGGKGRRGAAAGAAGNGY
jgi:hypothetical protein